MWLCDSQFFIRVRIWSHMRLISESDPRLHSLIKSELENQSRLTNHSDTQVTATLKSSQPHYWKVIYDVSNVHQRMTL